MLNVDIRKIDNELPDFPFAKGLKKAFSKKELEKMEKEAKKIKEGLKIINEKNEMTFEDMKKCYTTIMNELFGDLALKKAYKIKNMAVGLERDYIWDLINRMEKDIEIAKKQGPEYRDFIIKSLDGTKQKPKR